MEGLESFKMMSGIISRLLKFLKIPEEMLELKSYIPSVTKDNKLGQRQSKTPSQVLHLKYILKSPSKLNIFNTLKTHP